MEDLHTKLGYLRGLADGLGVNEETREGKVIQQIIGLLNDFVCYIEDMREDYDELSTYVEAIDEDLSDLENGFLEDDEGPADDDEERDYGQDYGDEDEDYDVSFTVECPECKYEVAIDEDILEDGESLEVLCPNCGRVVFINDEEWDDELGDLDEDDEEEN
ncbi:MAG: CD1247 N-terminal domain-containing protein [Dethiobacteria bacterium]|jgi:DNA-directed RNA polymerase subunit delta